MARVDSRVRPAVASFLGAASPTLTAQHCTVSKTEMATSMDIDGTPTGQPATLHGLPPQVQELPITHTGPPSSNGMTPFPLRSIQ